MTPRSTMSVPDSQLLSEALAACTVGVVMTDARQFDHPIMYVNPAFETLTGYKADEIIGRNCRFLQGSEHDQAGVQEIRQAMAEQRSTTVILRNHRKDGTLFYNELSLSPVHDVAGSLTHYLGFQNDVTEREEARQQLTSTLARVTDGFMSFDRHWNFTYVNLAAAALSGRTPAEFIGHNLFEAGSAVMQQPIGQALQRASQTGTVQHESSYVAEIGRWVEVTAYPGEDGVSLFTRDVTQQHQAQEEMRLSEERFSRVFEASPVAIIVSQLSNGHYLDVNPEFLCQSGYSREELIGRTAHDLNFWVNPLDWEEGRRTLQAQGKILNREVQFRVKSGAVADTVVSVVPLTIGGEACVMTLIRDVTLEKAARRELEGSEERYRRIAAELQRTLDLSLDLITSFDAEGRFITVSAACQQMLGYAPEELIGRRYLDFVHPDDQIITVQEASSMTAGQVTTIFQNRYVRRNGAVVWLEWTGVVMPGDPVMYCVARDITQRRAAEEDQSFLAAIVLASHNAIVGADLSGTIRSWNAGAERLYGYTEAEAIGQPTTIAIPAELHVKETLIFQRILQGERTEPFESVRLTKDGRKLIVLVTVSAVLDVNAQVIGVSKITRDITARHAAELKIQALNQDLKQQVDYVTSLRDINRSIASSADPRITLGLVLDNICQQLGVDAATALRINPGTLTLEYAATRGFSATVLLGTAVELGVGLAGQVALSRQPLNVPDLSGIPVLPEWRKVTHNEGLTAYFALPLIAKGQVVGVLELLHRRALAISPGWLEMLETLAGQAAIAVENAQLLQELEHKNLELRLAYDETIEGWSRALDLRDHETEGHSRRVTEMTVTLCQRLGASPEQIVQVRRGALLHDIGKMGIRDAVLLKPGPLTDEEWVEMKKHPGYAVDLLSPIEYLRPALDIPQHHHEKWDGSGYPLGLAGKAIPLTARAFAVVDVYDALTSARPYRQAWTRERAIAHIQDGAGSHFDPAIVEIFVHMQQSAPV